MKQHVSLVLSSGGARGLAHIGAIEELEASGYVIDAVVGCSMGALIGGLYATGQLPKVKDWFLSLTLSDMLSLTDISLNGEYLMKGEKIIDAIKEIVPDQRIEDLPIPFKCVATDINKGVTVVFDHGSLFDAMRASISIPMVFKPVEYKGTVLVDGGILNPLPIDLAQKAADEIVVSVNVSAVNHTDNHTPLLPPRQLESRKERIQQTILERLESSQNMVNVMLKTFNVMIAENTARTLRKYKPQVQVNIPMDRLGDFDYDRAADLIALGRQAMHEVL